MELKKSNKIIFYSMALMLGLLSQTLFFSCTKKTDEKVVATIGTKKIDAEHLKRSYQLDPKWGRGLSRKQAHQNQLDFLIDQKLFALAVTEQQRENDPSLKRYLSFIEKKELIKELYRQKVAEKINISDAEYQQAYQNSKKKIVLNYVFSTVRENAVKYAGALETTDFSELTVLQMGDKKGTTPPFSFGDMDENIERVAFQLKLGEVSEPIPTADGFMVVQLKDGIVEKFMSELDLAEQKNKIKKVIFDRRARVISNRYIKDLMDDKELSLQRDVFFALSGQLSKIISDKYSDDPVPIYVNDNEITSAQDLLKDLRDKTLITHKDGEMTVGEFLNNVEQMPAALRPNVKMSKQLKDAIGIMVRNEYLMAEAKKLGLQNSPAAKREIDIQSDEILAAKFVSHIKKHIKVFPADVDIFRNTENYQILKKKYNKSPNDEIIEDLILRTRLVEQKMHAADSLRLIYKVAIDSALFINQIKNPEQKINYNPAKMAIRELFN